MFVFVEIKEKENRRKSSHEYSDNNGADSFSPVYDLCLMTKYV